MAEMLFDPEFAPAELAAQFGLSPVAGAYLVADGVGPVSVPASLNHSTYRVPLCKNRNCDQASTQVGLPG